MPVNSQLFHDACPGTHKYLEIHYACLSSRNVKVPDLPAWLKHSGREPKNSVTTETTQNPKKVQIPVLVTGKVTTERPIPITTPTTTSTTQSTTRRTTSTSTTASPSTSPKSINRTQRPTPKTTTPGKIVPFLKGPNEARKRQIKCALKSKLAETAS